MGAEPRRRAVVTGGAAGIGFAIARRLLAEGWDVAIIHRGTTAHARRLEPVAKRYRRKLFLATADLCDEAWTDRAFRTIRRRLGAFDALIANAGRFPGRSPVRHMTLSRWRLTIDANLTATFLTCRAALPHLRRGGGIVAIASRAAFDGGGPGAAAYAAAKAGIVALCLSLAKELRRNAIGVDFLAPGPVDTDLYRRNVAENAPVPAPQAAADIAELVSMSLTRTMAGHVRHRLARRKPTLPLD